MLTKDKSLRNVPSLKIRYDPVIDGDKIITELYIPCLSQSIRYDRLAGFFGADALKSYSRGLIELFQNGGKARYIFSRAVSQEDLNLVLEAYKRKDEIPMGDLAMELGNSLDCDVNVANLAYLMSQGYVEIKITYVLDEYADMGHWKDGVFTDQYGYKIYFSGSSNETINGLTRNGETIMLHDNFNGDNSYTDTGTNLFEKIWNNTYAPGKVIAVPPDEVLLEKIESYNRDRLFESQNELDELSDLVVVDIDESSNEILLTDKTENELLKSPRVLQLLYDNRIRGIGENKYAISKITLHDLRDILPDRITRKNGKNIRYTDRAADYMSKQDLEIEKRTRIAMQIKSKEIEDDLLLEKYKHFRKIVDAETSVKLKEDQYLNAFHHYTMKSSMDFSVPGTGKTYIAYGMFAYLNSKLNNKRDVDHLVVFGPLNCFNVWKEECEKIFASKNTFTVFDITEHRYDYQAELKRVKYNIYLFNYEFFDKDHSEIKDSLEQILNSQAMVVFDEIHRIKKLGGVRASSVINIMNDLPQKPVYKLALTGTPLPNSFKDLHNYIEILYKDDLNAFLRDFSVITLQQADNSEEMANLIQRELYPLFTRTTKNDLNIPAANPDDTETLRVEPTEDEKRLYKLVSSSFRNPLVKFVRLIQAASNPQLLLESIDRNDIISAYDDADDIDEILSHIDDLAVNEDEIKETIKRMPIASKTQKAINLVTQKANEGKKVIVWCLFIKTITLVRDELTKNGIQVVTISGGDSPDERLRKLNDFKQGSVDVIVTNPNTLAESVSLHLQCHDAVYLEYGFNLTYMLQSKDRIHRVGLPEGTVTNYYYAIAGEYNDNQVAATIDNRIYDRLQEKAERMFSAIESGKLYVENNVSDLDDIRAIVEGL